MTRSETKAMSIKEKRNIIKTKRLLKKNNGWPMSKNVAHMLKGLI